MLRHLPISSPGIPRVPVKKKHPIAVCCARCDSFAGSCYAASFHLAGKCARQTDSPVGIAA